MITVCPNCSLALAVTAADLRAGQGFVRCSGCDGMFSALPTLRETHEPAPADPRPPTVSPAVLAPFEPTAAEAVSVDAASLDAANDDASALEFDPKRADVATVFVEPKGTIIVVDEPGDVDVLDVLTDVPPITNESTAVEQESSMAADAAADADRAMEPLAEMAEDGAAEADLAEADLAESLALPDEPPVATELEPVEVVDVMRSQADEAVQFEAAPDAEPAPAVEPAPDTESAPDAEAAPAIEPAGDADIDLSVFGSQPEPPPAWHHPALVAASVALVLLLGVQVIAHYRHDLATHPSLYSPLRSTFGAIGLPVVPRWDVRGYDVRQLGAFASTSGEGQLAVRMSVLNGAKVAQPAPLLRVNVQDRYGNTIATRDVPPAAYLPASMRATGFMQAGQRLDTEVRFVDPGPAAVGFEIDACVPSAEQSLVCAGGAR